MYKYPGASLQKYYLILDNQMEHLRKCKLKDKKNSTKLAKKHYYFCNAKRFPNQTNFNT